MRKLIAGSFAVVILAALLFWGASQTFHPDQDLEVHWSTGLVVVVDAELPTSIYATGIPQGKEIYHVGDSIPIVSWPAEANHPYPEEARVSGRVIWDIVDRPGASEWHAIDDTLGFLILLEPASSDDPQTLRAELQPEHPRPLTRSGQ